MAEPGGGRTGALRLDIHGLRHRAGRREGGGSRLRGGSVIAALALAGPAWAQAPAPSPLDAYAEAAATTIIAEQACPGVQVRAGQLTTLRLGARVGPAQEAILEEKLRSRAPEIRRQLAADGREAWCAQALAAFGPQGSVAKGILAVGTPIR